MSQHRQGLKSERSNLKQNHAFPPSKMFRQVRLYTWAGKPVRNVGTYVPACILSYKLSCILRRASSEYTQVSLSWGEGISVVGSPCTGHLAAFGVPQWFVIAILSLQKPTVILRQQYAWGKVDRLNTRGSSKKILQYPSRLQHYAGRHIHHIVIPRLARARLP